MKSHATFRMREALNDAMDVHSGKAVIDGPSNYLLPLYRAVPIGITVEGANIVTRSLIIFGQGSIRAHPHMLDNMMALQEPDRDKLARDVRQIPLGACRPHHEDAVPGLGPGADRRALCPGAGCGAGHADLSPAWRAGRRPMR